MKVQTVWEKYSDKTKCYNLCQKYCSTTQIMDFIFFYLYVVLLKVFGNLLVFVSFTYCEHVLFFFTFRIVTNHLCYLNFSNSSKCSQKDSLAFLRNQVLKKGTGVFVLHSTSNVETAGWDFAKANSNAFLVKLSPPPSSSLPSTRV